MPCDRNIKLLLLGLVLAVISLRLSALVPPVPAYNHPPAAWQMTKIEGSVSAGTIADKATRTIPNNILVLRVQFSDQSFRSIAAYPDSLAHNDAYFNRWMKHLKDFYLDASHGAYELESTLYPQVLTLPNPMAYYGADTEEKIDALLPEVLPHVLQQIDSEVDFSSYGGVIIFHAGAGQESDIDGIRTNQIWSTFLTRKNLQAAFDPENDNYAGYPTNDGSTLTNVLIIPEDEFQDYFPLEGGENASAYLFSIYGVLAHQFGHLIGLPTLFDNDSSNGRSQGIGNWGLMGTGVWNANGYVPAQVSAYCRYLLGWENPVIITSDAIVNPVDHFTNHTPEAIRLYKIPISGTEYFLVENRQQNPDGSIDIYNQHSYSFKLLPEGEQDYYLDNPETSVDESLIPYFSFMKNSYVGSEWDFFLPGLGGPFPSNSGVLQDGSGILIWHIDELVIAQNFTANFDLNRPNGNASHKGVDLEEADGMQNLDTAVYDIYKWGSPFDSFRANNNAYFGYQYNNGLLSLPTSESYYGGIPLEIHNISESGNRMYFSVRYRWSLSTAFSGENSLNAAAIDFDGDGQTEMFYPMPDGQLYMWKDDELMADFPLHKNPITQTYTWDGDNLYIPMEYENLARLYQLGNNESRYVLNMLNSTWASHPVDLGSALALPLNKADNKSSIFLLNKADLITTELFEFDGLIAANLIHFRNNLTSVHRGAENAYLITEFNLPTLEDNTRALPIPADSTIIAIFKAPLVPESEAGELIVQCQNSVYAFDAGLQLLEGFPFCHNLVAASDSSYFAPLSLADVDANGSLDLLIGGAKGFAVLDYHGSLMSPAALVNDAAPDSIGAGVYAIDIDSDGKAEILGNFGYNRLSVWEDDFRVRRNFPVAFSERSRNYPFIAKAANNKSYIYCAADNGKIFRSDIVDTPLANPALSWNTEYANLLRSASIDPQILPNQYSSSSLFVPGQVYIYPNPLKSIYTQKLVLNVMPSEDCEVELSIFDISGTLVFRQKSFAKAYLKNLDIFSIPSEKLCSGVYLAIVKSPRESKRLKFAIEK
ncbi:MAG: M6 family metalloprotease domain-containing protein [Candidatus Cloacimonetes bacterium]|nr:M6 family metalloprotease domain-containing protein [Candidatus Cloacimonadota bacterium]